MQLIKSHHLTFGLYERVNDDNKVDLGGGSAFGIVPCGMCQTKKALYTPITQYLHKPYNSQVHIRLQTLCDLRHAALIKKLVPTLGHWSTRCLTCTWAGRLNEFGAVDKSFKGALLLYLIINSFIFFN